MNDWGSNHTGTGRLTPWCPRIFHALESQDGSFQNECCCLTNSRLRQSDPRKIALQWDGMIRAAGSLELGKVQASVLVRSLLKSERLW